MKLLDKAFLDTDLLDKAFGRVDPKPGVVYYIAGSKYEGCSHQHRTSEAARKCLPSIDATHGQKPAIYRMVAGSRKRGTKVQVKR